MKAVGRIVHVCGRRMLIVAVDAAQLPPLYVTVVDRRHRPVGRVVDLFGNVKRPYAAVLCRDRCEHPVGEKIFSRS
jgi:RNA-binding protein